MSGYEDWVTAFWELSTDRQLGMAVGPIPSSSIRQWTKGWHPSEAEMFRKVIRVMDSAYREWTSDKDKSKETVRAAARNPQNSAATREAAAQAEANASVRTPNFNRNMMREAFGGRSRRRG